MHNKRYSNGFTLMELMVTLVIATLLATVAIPSFNGLIKKNRISTYTNNLVTSLALARSEAVKRGTQISLCASSNGTNCTNTSFQQGWIVFTDQNTAGTVDGTDTILRVQEATAGLTFTVTGKALVQYRSSGVLVADASINGYDWLAEASATIYAPTLVDHLFSSLLPGTSALASSPMTPPGQDDDSTPPGQDDDRTPPGQEPGAPSDPLRTGVTNFDICTSDSSGEPGILVVVSITGRISTLNITCS